MDTEFNPGLFKLSREISITNPYPSVYYDISFQQKMRKVLYNDEPLTFILSGERICQCGISFKEDFFSVSFDFQSDSNFFSLLENILTEIRKIYPDIQTDFLQVKTIRVNIVEFTNFYPAKPPIKTKFKINSIKVGFFRVENLYKKGILDKSNLDLVAYEVYM